MSETLVRHIVLIKYKDGTDKRGRLPLQGIASMKTASPKCWRTRRVRASTRANHDFAIQVDFRHLGYPCARRPVHQKVIADDINRHSTGRTICVAILVPAAARHEAGFTNTNQKYSLASAPPASPSRRGTCCRLPTTSSSASIGVAPSSTFGAPSSASATASTTCSSM